MTTLTPPKFVDAPAMLLGGIDQRYKCDQTQAIPEQWQKIAPSFGSIPGQVGFVAYGVCHELSPEEFSYMAGVELSSTDQLPEGFTTIQLPAQRYAVFAFTEHISQMKQAAAHIWCDWLPQSGCTVPDRPVMLERYGEDFCPDKGQGDIELWVSINP